MTRNICVALGARNIYVAFINSSQARRDLAKRGATFAPGKGLWLAILKQLDIKD